MSNNPQETLRYAVLRHEDIPEPHYDLLIEISRQAPLLTFRCDDWPPVAPPLRQGDHRRIYLTYEGPISDNRGSVRRIAQGTIVILENNPGRLGVQLIPGPMLSLAL